MAQHRVARPLTYLHNIPSVHESNQGVPAVLGANALDLNRGILAGAAIDRDNLTHAKKVAKALRTIHELSLDNRITAAVVNSAELRVAAIEVAHAFATYTPVNIEQALQNISNQITAGFNQLNQHFDQLNEELNVTTAISRNTRVLAHNHRRASPNAYSPLYKTMPGDGLDLATNLYGEIPDLRNHLVAPAQRPAVGTVPPNFSNNFTAYTRADFVRLIIFYNEDFGIVAGDTIATCVDKFHLFLGAD